MLPIDSHATPSVKADNTTGSCTTRLAIVVLPRPPMPGIAVMALLPLLLSALNRDPMTSRTEPSLLSIAWRKIGTSCGITADVIFALGILADGATCASVTRVPMTAPSSVSVRVA